METLLEAVTSVSIWMRPHLPEIGLSILATLLIIFGQSIMSFVRQQIGALNLMLKLILFGVIAAFGLIFITSQLTPWLMTYLAQLPDVWLSPVIVLLFLGIGWLAHRRGNL
ncbi:MAG: DUF3392 family protein [Hydrogenovibrio sp.]